LEFKRNQKACIEGTFKKVVKDFGEKGIKATIEIDWDAISKDANKANISKFLGYESQFAPLSYFPNLFKDKVGIDAFNLAFDKIVINVSSGTEMTSTLVGEGKTLKISVTGDFKDSDGYGKGIGCWNKEDELAKLCTSSSGINPEFERAKATAMKEWSDKCSNFKKEGGEAVVTIDMDSIAKDANSVNICKWLSYSSQLNLKSVFAYFLKDATGKEVFNESFTKIVCKCETSTSKSAPEFSKDGTTLIATFYYDWSLNDGYGNGGISWVSDEAAQSKIESLM